MQKKKGPIRWLAVAVAAALLPIAQIPAAELDFEVTGGAASSDNIARAAQNEQSETVAIVGLQFSLDEQTRRLAANLVGDFSYNDYLDDTYDSEFVGSFAGQGRVTLVEDRLAWTLSDYFGQTMDDPFLPETPDNRGNINYLTTGLEGGFGIGAQTLIGLGVNYAVATYEDEPLDSSTLGFDANVTREIAEGNSLGLNVRSAQVDYDEEALSANDYDQFEGFIRYAVTGARTELNVDVGYTSIDSDATGSEGGGLLRLEVQRRMSSSQALTLNVGQEFSNSASAFALGQEGGDVGLGSVPGEQNANPFVLQTADLRWDVNGRRTTFALSAGWQNQKYDDQPLLDQEFSVLSANIGRDLSASFSANLGVSYTSVQFDQPGGDYSELLGNAGVSWRMTRHMVMNLDYVYRDRDSDLAQATYQENRIWLRFGYQRGKPSRSLRGDPFDQDE